MMGRNDKRHSDPPITIQRLSDTNLTSFTLLTNQSHIYLPIQKQKGVVWCFDPKTGD